MARKKQSRKAQYSDRVEFGSDRHADHLELKKASEDDVPQRDGWALIDITAYGSAARPEFLREVLRQKVTTLQSGPPPTPQSEDQFAPDYAPPMWPHEEADLAT